MGWWLRHICLCADRAADAPGRTVRPRHTLASAMRVSKSPRRRKRLLNEGCNLADRDRSILKSALEAAGAATGRASFYLVGPRSSGRADPGAASAQAAGAASSRPRYCMGPPSERKEPELPRLCLYYERGSCVRGLACKHARVAAELEAALGRLKRQEAK